MKWDPKDQITMFDLMPNSVDSVKKTEVREMNDFDWEDDFRYCVHCKEVLTDDDVSYYDACEDCGNENGDAS